MNIFENYDDILQSGERLSYRLKLVLEEWGDIPIYWSEHVLPGATEEN